MVWYFSAAHDQNQNDPVLWARGSYSNRPWPLTPSNPDWEAPGYRQRQNEAMVERSPEARISPRGPEWEIRDTYAALKYNHNR